MKRASKPRILFGFAMAAVFCIDRSIKAAVLASPADVLLTVPGLLRIVRVANAGYAFSLFSGGSAGILAAFSAIALAALAAAEWKYRHYWLQRPIVLTALAAVTGGAIGNLYDRISTGAVTDYIELSFVRFPVFNFADICITCGLLVVALFLLAGPELSQNKGADV